MPKGTVYKVKLHNVITDETHVSRRIATQNGAVFMRGDIIPETGIAIDGDRLERGEEWTDNRQPRWHDRRSGPCVRKEVRCHDEAMGNHEPGASELRTRALARLEGCGSKSRHGSVRIR